MDVRGLLGGVRQGSKRFSDLPFQSWDEAEAHLGLEIADNARLDQMEKGLWGMSLSERREPVVAPCILDLRSNNRSPDMITRIKYQAQFILHQASFCVRVSVAEGGAGEDALSLLKEILHACEQRKGADPTPGSAPNLLSGKTQFCLKNLFFLILFPCSVR